MSAKPGCHRNLLNQAVISNIVRDPLSNSAKTRDPPQSQPYAWGISLSAAYANAAAAPIEMTTMCLGWGDLGIST